MAVGKQVSKLTRADRLFKKSHELFDIFGRQHAAEACTVVVDQMPHPFWSFRRSPNNFARRSSALFRGHLSHAPT